MDAIPAYAELHCLSNFSFLRGASHPEELVARACELGYSAVALTDECSVAGVVRAHLAAKEYGLKLLIGSELTIEGDGPVRASTGSARTGDKGSARTALKVVLLAPDRAAYGDLCQLITVGRRAAEKGAYRLTVEDLAKYSGRCLALWVPGDDVAEVGRPLPTSPR